jgi:hypothetical protein
MVEILNNPIWSFDEEIIDLKNELADLYIQKIKEKKWSSLSSFIIGEWNVIKDYLVSEWLLDKIWDNLKWNFINQLLDWLDPETSQYFQEAKRELDNANTKDQLTQLKQKILNPVDDKEDVVLEQDISKNDDIGSNNVKQNTDSKIVSFVPVYLAYKNLIVSKDINQDEIEYVWENSEYIVEKLETKWNLTKIKKIKNKEWKIILECTWQTPYINSKVASDLVWFALMYYKKTWSKLIIESGYRTISHQEDLKNKNQKLKIPTADPGYSWHNLWYSIDISKDSRYDKKIWWVEWIKKIAEIFDFYPISSEDWHFDHKEFVDNYYNDKSSRWDVAQNLNVSYEDNRSMAA